MPISDSSYYQSSSLNSSSTTDDSYYDQNRYLYTTGVRNSYNGDDSSLSQIGSHFAGQYYGNGCVPRSFGAVDDEDAGDILTASRPTAGASTEGSRQLGLYEAEYARSTAAWERHFAQYSSYENTRYGEGPYFAPTQQQMSAWPLSPPNGYSIPLPLPGQPQTHYDENPALQSGLFRTSYVGSQQGPSDYRPPDGRLHGHSGSEERPSGPSQQAIRIDPVDPASPSSIGRPRRRPRGVFPCDQCPEVFTRIGDCNRHKEGKHEGIHYRCEQYGCTRITSRVDKMKEHSRRRHGGIVLYSKLQ